MLMIIIWILIFCKADKDGFMNTAKKVYIAIYAIVAILSLLAQNSTPLIVYTIETIVIYYLYKIFKDTIQKYL